MCMSRVNVIVSITESYKNGIHSQVTLILHHLKDFINLSPQKYSQTARYFLFSWFLRIYSIICFVFGIHVYVKLCHVFHAYQCKWPIGPFAQ